MIPPSDKKPPEIIGEEDIPLIEMQNTNEANHESDKQLPKETDAEGWMERRKFNLGSATLGWFIGLMVVCILLSLLQPDNELVHSGFEAFKLIVMTILGYIFGSNTTKHD